jgi:bacteriorhodopsin
MKLGGKFWIVLIASVVGVVVAGAIVVALFGWAWYELGFLGAFLILSGILLAFGWGYDRREQNRRKRLAAS